MKKNLTLLLAMFIFMSARANDGAFFSTGNQLIPITESTIRVQKEILTITRVRDTINKFGSMFQVNVYYEFFNPGPAKNLIVGFESPTPDEHASEASLSEIYARNPFIYDFKVLMNQRELPYQVAHVPYRHVGEWEFDYTRYVEDYYRNGRIQDMSLEQYNAALTEYFKNEEEYTDVLGYLFYYVYHFNAHFKTGLNIIQHTYTVKGSIMVMEEYLFDYILTAANRWANNGIDDFTLELNMGDCQSFSIEPSFFRNADEWAFSGKGRVGQRRLFNGMCEDCPMFHVQSGSIVYHKKNFHPEGELHITSDGFDLNFYSFQSADRAGIEGLMNSLKTQYCNLNVYLYEENPIDISNVPADLKRIMRNMPFAYRGYVFQDQGLQRFFASTDWYLPNPDYVADMTVMNEGDKNWINFWSK